MADIARRGFLRQLAALPLIGGGVTLIGTPKAVAEPVTYDLMQAYKTWLHFEHRTIAWELAQHPKIAAFYGGRSEDRFDFIERLIVFDGTGEARRYHRWDGTSPAADRAALVLSTVGCDWREADR